MDDRENVANMGWRKIRDIHMSETTRHTIHVLDLLLRQLRTRPGLDCAYAFYDFADLQIHRTSSITILTKEKKRDGGAYIELELFPESQVTRDAVESCARKIVRSLG